MNGYKPNPELAKHLPETILFKDTIDVYHLLKKCQKVFIKPKNGSLGKGIMELSTNKNGFLLRYRKKGQNKEHAFSDWNLASEFLKSRLRENEFIIQKALDITTHQKRKIDFRMIVVKDSTGD